LTNIVPPVHEAANEAVGRLDAAITLLHADDGADGWHASVATDVIRDVQDLLREAVAQYRAERDANR
jgi:hypothetical protein